jgi:hypothetical protein
MYRDQAAFARTFTRAMHQVSMGPASAWPELVDLSGHQVMLDVGGGSGAHAIGATQRWPGLQAIVFDLAAVCEVALEYIARHGLQGRIRTQAGDMMRDPFPPADLHLYSWVYYALPRAQRHFLTRKSFESLAPGGRIILHEMLYRDEASDLLAAGADNSLTRLLSREGRRFGQELCQVLREGGFSEIEVKPALAPWSIVTGRKSPQPGHPQNASSVRPWLLASMLTPDRCGKNDNYTVFGYTHLMLPSWPTERRALRRRRHSLEARVCRVRAATAIGVAASESSNVCPQPGAPRAE